MVALGGLESGGTDERASEGELFEKRSSQENCQTLVFFKGTGSHPALWEEGEVESGLKSLCYVAYRR